MPFLSENSRKHFIQLKNGYENLPSDEKLLFPSALAAKLKELDVLTPSIQSAFEVYQAYISHTRLPVFSDNSLINLLEDLRRIGLLTGDAAQPNFYAVVGHEDPVSVAFTLIELEGIGLLTGDAAQPNFYAVAGHENPRRFARAFFRLRLAELIGIGIEQSQARFDGLITYQDILCHGTTRDLWDKISWRALTEARWNQIMLICRENTVNLAIGRQRFTDYVYRELLELGAPQQRALKARQSTHTAAMPDEVEIKDKPENQKGLRARHVYFFKAHQKNQESTNSASTEDIQSEDIQFKKAR